jgi:hypothetical protein
MVMLRCVNAFRANIIVAPARIGFTAPSPMTAKRKPTGLSAIFSR